MRENATKEEECCVCRGSSTIYILPCHHSHCQHCFNILEGKTIQCGICHFTYTISQDRQEVSDEEDGRSTSHVWIITQNEACSRTEVWCCKCGTQNTKCLNRGARSLSESSAFENGNQSDAYQDSEDDPEIFMSTVSSLDFNSLLESSEMETTASDFYSSINLDKCTEHGYALSNYCFSHEIPCCPDCTTIHHKVCDTLDIHKAATDVPSESEVNRLKHSLCSLTDIHQGMIYEMENNIAEIDKESKKIWTTFEEFKAAVQNKLKKLEDNVKAQIQETESKQNHLQTDLNDVKERCKSLQNTRTQLEGLTFGNAESLQLYCKAKAKMGEQKRFIHTQRQTMFKFRVSITEHQHRINHLEQIPNLIQTKVDKAKLETLKKMKCSEKLEVRRWTRTKLSHITGMCYLEDVLVICDNSKQRIFTLDSRRAWYCIKLQHSPWDVTPIEAQKIAVSTPSGIQIVDLKFLPDKKLGFPSFLPTTFQCFGVSYLSGNLYIASNSHIYIIRIDGSHLRTIKCKGFSVQHVCVKNADCIYYSDTNSNRVFCVNSVGDILKVFTSDYMEAPKGLAIGPSTNILVVNSLSKTVHRFTMDGHLVESLEMKSKDMDNSGPEVICSNKDSCAIAAKQIIYRCLFV
ncbi:uncharacterized protein LOC134236893 [Saccostrea cucullata]|uniref:uncharacterized protein LOC134236893 n=1 Tax=Saccostrea cuccullata TaxID=36930 RepID=UPI002ED6C048